LGYDRPHQEASVADDGLKILMVTSEVVPFAKAGGLADMVGAMSRALVDMGHDVRVVLPRYYSVDVSRFRRIGGALGVPLGRTEEWCAVYEGRLPDSEVPVYFLDHEELFGRDGIYGTRLEPSFHDNLDRFAVLCRGALQLAMTLEWRPDVVHAHDWPGALASVYLNTVDKGGAFATTANVLTIHNLGYQGVFPKTEFETLGLPWDLFHGAGFEFFDDVNVLQAGIRNADLLTTVSPTYAEEIQTPAFGHRLDDLLRFRKADLFGVLNGMDYGEWSPETDEHIVATYSHRGHKGKAKNKAALQAEFGLEQDPEIPVYGMVSRLVEQKGFGQLCGPAHGSLASMCAQLDLQFVILGTGEAWCEDELQALAQRYPNLGVRVAFDNRLAHQITAGSDFFLMPSMYEPCGLSQMYALRYGTLPIVRATGGLADTVENYDETTGEGTGFVFAELNPAAIYNTVGWSLWAWHNRRDHVVAMRKRAMKKRFDWSESARRYVELYHLAIDRRLGVAPRS
jgi:starch synthase